MGTSFPAMDVSTQEQWAEIGRQTMANQGRVAEAYLKQLKSLEAVTDGFNVDQLEHALQTATRAERAGADEEVVFASLFHDLGKSMSVANHPAISAEMVKPFVRDEVYHMIRTHQDFQGRHYYAHFNADPDAREQYRDEPWFDLTAQFADEWDQKAFADDYDTEPLEHFEDLVRRLTSTPNMF